MTAFPPPGAQRHEYVADGVHAGLHWWILRMPGAAHPVATVIGWDDGDYVTEQAELERASRARVEAWVDGILASYRARRAKKAMARRTGRT